jgi:DNA-binding transcriptional regulator YiaG
MSTNQVTGSDVLLARRRAKLSQQDLARALGWYKQVLPPIEAEALELSQAEYQHILDTIASVAAGREVAR